MVFRVGERLHRVSTIQIEQKKGRSLALKMLLYHALIEKKYANIIISQRLSNKCDFFNHTWIYNSLKKNTIKRISLKVIKFLT